MIHLQSAIEQDYAGVCARFGFGILHLVSFFSPRIIPTGLTDDEVHECLILHCRREPCVVKLREKSTRESVQDILRQCDDSYFAQENLRLAVGDLGNIPLEDLAHIFACCRIIERDFVPLPAELRVCPMTRESFVAGKEKLVQQLSQLGF